MNDKAAQPTIFFPALVFDVETTGLFKYRLAADDPSQPRVCQIAGALVSEDERVPLKTYEAIIKPDGWTVPEGATEIHGLTTEKCADLGIPIKEALDGFMALYDRALVLAAFGMTFDSKALRAELRRDGRPDRFGEKLEACVMRAATPVCDIPPTEKMSAAGRNYPKTPNLTEACQIILGETHEDAHDALADVGKTVTIYRSLVTHGQITPKYRESFKQPEQQEA